MLAKGMVGVVNGCVLVCNGLKVPRVKLLKTKVSALTSHVVVIVIFTIVFFYAQHCRVCGRNFLRGALGQTSFLRLGGLK